MQERDLIFDVNLSIPVLLILEAPEDNDEWRKIHNVASNLIKSLLGRIETIYFLGNVKTYSIATLADFQREAPGWYFENRARVSIVGDIFEKLIQEEFKGIITVISSALPIDVEDWVDTELIKKTLFVRVIREPFPGDYWQINSGASNISEELNNPVQKLFVKGKGFVPICYEKGDVSFKDGAFQLEIPIQEGRLQLHLKALYEDQPPVLYIERERGFDKAYAKEEKPWFEEPEWNELSDDNRPIINAGISKEEFKCPHCRNSHPYNTLICPENGPILRRMPLDRTILFKKDKWFSISKNWYAYPLKDNIKIITKDGSIYSWENGLWKLLQEKIKPYEQIEGDIYGLLHKIR